MRSEGQNQEGGKISQMFAREKDYGERGWWVAERGGKSLTFGKKGRKEKRANKVCLEARALRFPLKKKKKAKSGLTESRQDFLRHEEKQSRAKGRNSRNASEKLPPSPKSAVTKRTSNPSF